MVIEKRSIGTPIAVVDGGSRQISNPVPYAVVVRIDDQRDKEAVDFLLRATFGENVAIRAMQGGRVAARTWLEIGHYPREIAEARAERVRRGAAIGRLGVVISIRRSDVKS